MKKSCEKINNFSPNRQDESGFSLVEVVIAMVVFLIVLLGASLTFSYAVNYNSGNSSRAQALTVLQQEIENLRSAKFTPAITDAALTGGVKSPRTVSSANGNRFIVQITVDDDPATAGVQTDNTKTLKEITVSVALDSPTPGWQSSVPSIVVMRRVRAN